MKRPDLRMITIVSSALLLSFGITITAHGGGTEDDCAVACGCRSSCCATGAIVAGAELALLTPHGGSLSVGIPGEAEELVVPGFDIGASPRVWLGYQNANGVTGRVRYWQFDHSQSIDEGPLRNADLGLEAHTLDLEFGQVGHFCGWECETTGGIRWATVSNDMRVAFDGDDVIFRRRFEGVGPTVAFATRRPVGCRGLAMVGSIRASLLYGDANFAVEGDLVEDLFDAAGSLTADLDEDFAQIYEIQIGAEWSRVFRSGALLTARAVLEAQSWEVLHLGFIGPAISLGIER